MEMITKCVVNVVIPHVELCIVFSGVMRGYV